MIRPIWGLCLYLMTFYMLPIGWWWGKGTLVGITDRWNLVAALIFAVAVNAKSNIHNYRFDPTAKRVFTILLYYSINATLVHYTMASNAVRSANGLELIWKHLGLALLIYFSIWARSDFKKIFYALILLSFYIGYEVVINERGNFSSARLEGIFIPGAAEANYLAGLLCLALPLAGAFVLIGRKREKIVAVIASPFIFDVILRCNSRGAYLALMASGVLLVRASKGRMRRLAVVGGLLVALSVSFQAKDEEIWERFYSIFPAATGEEVDQASQSRLDFWEAGRKMIFDYPLGSGAEAAFKSPRGSPYISKFGQGRYRAVHNGYIDIAAGWGVQGFALYITAIFLSWWSLRKAISFNYRKGKIGIAFVGISIEASLVTQLTACFFISSLDGEWFYWLMAIMLGYGKLYGPTDAEYYQMKSLRHRVSSEEMDAALKEDPFSDALDAPENTLATPMLPGATNVYR